MGLAIALALFLLALAAVLGSVYAVSWGIAHFAHVALITARERMRRTHP